MLDKINDDYLQAFPTVQAISIFDAVEYEFYDYDGLGPSQRNYLLEKLKNNGFIQKSGKWLVHENNIKVFFPAPKMFNRDFVSFLSDERPGGNIWFATTPTQTAYLLFKITPFDFRDLAQLMMHHPFNLEKLLQATYHEDIHLRVLQHQAELERLHERAKLLLKRKTPLGSLN